MCGLPVNVVCNTPEADFSQNDTFVRAVRANSGVVRQALTDSQHLRYQSSLDFVAAMRTRGQLVRYDVDSVIICTHYLHCMCRHTCLRWRGEGEVQGWGWRRVRQPISEEMRVACKRFGVWELARLRCRSMCSPHP